MRTATGIRLPNVAPGWSWEVTRQPAGLYTVNLIRPDGRQAYAVTVTDIWGTETTAPKKGDIGRAARRLLEQREYSRKRRHRESGSVRFVGRYGATVRVDEARLRATMAKHPPRPTDEPGTVTCTCDGFEGDVVGFTEHRDTAVRDIIGGQA